MKQLLIGCGSNLKKQVFINGISEWSDLTTLDNNPNHKPNVVHDLNNLPLPFENDMFNEIHAYEVLEHTGRQGDYEFFFAQFTEFWRILEPNGFLFATVPSIKSHWAWGDPSHTRVILPVTLLYLDQEQYDKQVGITAMSDFRYIYKADFRLIESRDDDINHGFILQAIKPSRSKTV